jgi:hypothetical protein
MTYWDAWRSGHITTYRFDLELRMWASQYCVQADDFAFSIVGAMQSYLNQTAG